MKKTIFAFSLLFTAFLYAAPQKVERFLLVAGANDGGKDRVKLRYAESDANSFANVMSQMGGVAKNNVLRVFDPNAKAMQNGFAELKKRLQNEGADVRKEVIVYYSGHADEKGLRLGSDVYSWADLRKDVNNINADVKIAILDACGSGAITRTKGGASKPAFLQDASSSMRGYAYLTSSNENEASQESDRLKGSFFTHALVSGLRGAADMTGSGKVTLNEAYQFAFNETLQSTQSTSGGTQHPSRDMNLAGTGDVVMTDLREVSASLVLDKNMEGRFFIRDEKGNLVAELYKTSGKIMELGLPAGKYSIQMEAPSRLWKAGEVELIDGKKQELSMNNMKNINREVAVSRGDADSSAMTGLDSARAAPFRVNPFGYSDKPENGVQFPFVTYASSAFVGTQISLLGNFATDDMAGAQISALVNVANNIHGVQGSSTINIAKNFTGVQASIHNIALNGKGVQAGVINIYADSLDGAQGAVINTARKVSVGQGGVINIAWDAGKVQGGVINVAGSTEYVQGGVINVAGNAGKVQGSVINVAGSVEEIQGGVINIGGHVGRQVGIINISAKSDKTPIGLINIVGNGIIDATLYADETGRGGAVLHMGTPYFYSLFEYTAKPIAEFPMSWGWGLGTRFGRWGNFFNLEYVFLDTYGKNPHNFSSMNFTENNSSNYLQKIRFGGAYKLLPGIALSSGITLNALSEGYGNNSLYDVEPRGKYHWEGTFGDHKVRMWPGLYAGLTVGKF